MRTAREAESRDALVRVLKALADPVRLELLQRVAETDGEIACTTLVHESTLSASTVSYHVKMLRSVGLVGVRKDGRNFHYSYRPAAMNDLALSLVALDEPSRR